MFQIKRCNSHSASIQADTHRMMTRHNLENPFWLFPIFFLLFFLSFTCFSFFGDILCSWNCYSFASYCTSCLIPRSLPVPLVLIRCTVTVIARRQYITSSLKPAALSISLLHESIRAVNRTRFQHKSQNSSQTKVTFCTRVESQDFSLFCIHFISRLFLNYFFLLFWVFSVPPTIYSGTAFIRNSQGWMGDATNDDTICNLVWLCRRYHFAICAINLFLFQQTENILSTFHFFPFIQLFFSLVSLFGNLNVLCTKRNTI